MRFVGGSTVLLLTLHVASQLNAADGSAGKENIAVLEFTGGGVSRETMQQLADEVRTAAVKVLSQDYMILTKSNQERVLREQKVDLSKCEVGSCDVDTLRNLHAKYGIVGNVLVTNGGKKRVMLQLYNVERGVLIDSERVAAATEDELIDETFKAATALIQRRLGRTGPSADSNRRSAPNIGGVNLGGVARVVVSFESDPPGAGVRIDGELICDASPCGKAVTIGPHEVVMEKARFKAATQNIDVSSANKNVALKLDPRFGWLSIATVPPGLQVSINHEKRGPTPIARLELDPGRYEVVVDDPCYVEKGGHLTVKEGAARAVNIEPMPRLTGLSVDAREGNNDIEARVYVDGEDVGTTPVKLQVALCAKELRAVAPSGGEFKTALQLAPGTINEIDATFAAGEDEGDDRDSTSAKSTTDKRDDENGEAEDEPTARASGRVWIFNGVSYTSKEAAVTAVREAKLQTWFYGSGLIAIAGGFYLGYSLSDAGYNTGATISSVTGLGVGLGLCATGAVWQSDLLLPLAIHEEPAGATASARGTPPLGALGHEGGESFRPTAAAGMRW